jgi:hypothetical protein
MPATAAMTYIGSIRPGLWRRIHEDVAGVKARDPAARFTLEIVLTYPGVHAVVWCRFANRLWRAGFRFLARLPMPDPVGDALAALIDRIEFLEARLAEMQHSARSAAGAGRPTPSPERINS